MRLILRISPLILIVGVCCSAFAAAPELFVSNDDIRAQSEITAKPFWQTSVGPGLPDELRLLANGHLLVGLRRYDRNFSNMDLTLIDTSTGQVTWRYDRKKHKGKYFFLAADRGYLLYKVTQEKKGKVGILALQQSSGKEAWFLPLQGRLIDLKTEVSQHVLLATTQHAKGKITIRAIGIESGKSRWERSWRSDQENPWLLAPAIHNQTLFSPYQGLECLSLTDGQSLWKRKDIKIAQVAASMRIVDSRFVLIDSTNTLQALNPASGATLVKHQLDENVNFSSIISLGQVYLLGQKPGGDSLLVALPIDLGEILWQQSGVAVPLSNLVLKDDRIYYASGTMIFSFDVRSGESGPSALVSLVASKLPVRLRLVGDKIIYFGEYVISDLTLPGLKSNNYHGITPITNELSTKGLDKVISRTKKKLSASQQQNVDTFASRMADNQIAQYRAYVVSANPGKYINPDSISPPDFMLYQKTAASTWEATEAILKAYKESGLEHQLNEVSFLREIVVAQLAQATGREYVYRPHSEGSFNGIKLVNLLTGQSVVQVFSPSYLEYGFWNLVDFEMGVVYHHGLGLDPEKYEKSEKFKTFTQKKERLFNSSIIAYPLDL